ncbi:Por secretion system C-terminal sorting domain-containing protein [Soonwooa buanensis]|uniref:Por secretion system C-terminal sorting domain-containing protein n=1 Tax=Soonwooa buanensis TaxID=619805 RepID=A0A1T5CZL4_9FLAO|nr:T9SS type A sorting domain-containing protein [Soonwooa buanensis]SKB64958.1 Por secretion system C-terminal sorting domain-containing protein [Soonwooa buanensis]
MRLFLILSYCLEVHDNQVLSVKEDSFAKFNPVDDQLYVSSEQSIQKIKIASLSGQKVLEFLPKSKNLEVSTKSLKTGMYILSVMIVGKEKSFKILKK